MTVTDTLVSTRSRNQLLAGLLVAVWLGILGTDWWFRFAHYRWHERVLISRTDPARREDRTWEVAPSRGGDLSLLLADRSVAARFEEPRPGGVDARDRWGYRNLPSPEGRWPRVVVTGDSYMFTGPTVEHTVAATLAEALDTPVYNAALAGRGYLSPLYRVLEDARFRSDPPDVLVWGFVDRDFNGIQTEGLRAFLRRWEAEADGAEPRRRWIEPGSLSPAALAESLPNTSVWAQRARRHWASVQVRAPRVDAAPDGPARAPAGDVLVSRPGPPGAPDFLLVRDSADMMALPPEAFEPDRALTALRELDAALTERGVRLVVVLVPDKGRVHPDRVPMGGREAHPSPFAWLAPRLTEAGVATVWLEPAFRERAAHGEMLYWRDDTHWNLHGVEVAAQAVADAIRADAAADPGTPP